MTLAERFWNKVTIVGDDDSCWPWTGALTGNGYGKIREGGRGSRFLGAHQAAVLLDGREIPPGMDVMHSCDNRPCVRPSHLVVGTRSENLLDSVAKGRYGTHHREKAA